MIERERFELKIGTSRYGTPVEVWSDITKSLNGVESVLVALGSPRIGLTDILSRGGKTPNDVSLLCKHRLCPEGCDSPN